MFRAIAQSLMILSAMICLPAGIASAASSGHIKTGILEIRATVPGMTATGGYLAIANKSDADDRLIAVSADFAEKVEIHRMINDDGVMKMRPVAGGVVVGAGDIILLQPGGLHLMFMGMTAPLNPGDMHHVTLDFASGAMKRVQAMVKKPADISVGADHDTGHDTGHDDHDHSSDHKHDHDDGHDHNDGS